MKIFFSPKTQNHSPKTFISRGHVIESPERAERADILRTAAENAGHTITEIFSEHHHSALDIHDEAYISFLKNGWQQWSILDGSSDEIIPNVHPGRNMNANPSAIVSAAGYYQADTACPIGEKTWEGAKASADTVIAAAANLLDRHKNNEHENFVYSLCRPPGHHAYADQAGGFCFLNNCAIAANFFLKQGLTKIAILDVDVHHGNGTQGIFYERSDVLTVSLHGDPSEYYPFFAGYEEEVGLANGKNFNINYPLSRGTADIEYMRVLQKALGKIKDFKPQILIIALGLDASEEDPLAFLALTTKGFLELGKVIASAKLPTIIVQEGGYISPILGDNLTATLKGFEDNR